MDDHYDKVRFINISLVTFVNERICTRPEKCVNFLLKNTT